MRQFQAEHPSAKRLENAIISLKVVNTIGNILHFGFSIDSVVRSLAITEEGSILIALCTAATESFATNHAANMLWELVRTFKAPEKQTLSPLQWKALLNVCAGTLAETEFLALAENLMRLCAKNDGLVIGRYETETHRQIKGISCPDDKAEVLAAIRGSRWKMWLPFLSGGGMQDGWLPLLSRSLI